MLSKLPTTLSVSTVFLFTPPQISAIGFPSPNPKTKMLRLIPLLLTLCTAIIAHAAPPPPTLAGEFLEPHNQARAEVGLGPLKWSEALANSTSKLVRYQREKEGCQFANLTNSRFGGNQLWASGAAVSPLMVVRHWVQEKSFYNYGNNSCEGDHRCGVYTQVVWKKSLEVGCAQATCKKEQCSLTICLYNPPGNIVGEKPY